MFYKEPAGSFFLLTAELVILGLLQYADAAPYTSIEWLTRDEGDGELEYHGDRPRRRAGQENEIKAV